MIPSAASAQDAATYAQPVYFEWDTAVLDVLIVPPAPGQLVNGYGVLNGGRNLDPLDPDQAFDPMRSELGPRNSYLSAVRASIHAWRAAVDLWAPEWLRDGLVLNVYVLGLDETPQEALEDPEVLITFGATMGPVVGIGQPIGRSACVVHNSRAWTGSFTYADMYNVNAHEFGHCLGLAHVRDDQPPHDVMDGTFDDPSGQVGTHLHCASNLNVKGLERVFGRLFGREGGGEAVLAAPDYAKAPCGGGYPGGQLGKFASGYAACWLAHASGGRTPKEKVERLLQAPGDCQIVPP